MNESYSIELRPNRSLLDSSFEGYKLSLETIPLYERSFESGVYVVRPSDIQFSFLHAKLFSLNNHLHTNPYNLESLYFVSKNLEICKIIFSPTTFNVELEKVFIIPNINFQSNSNYNISIAFVLPELVLINNGSGSTYFVKIMEQNNTEIWKILDVVVDNESAFLKDARLEISENDNKTLHIIFLCIKEKTESETKNLKTGLFKTILMWKALSLKTNETLVEIYLKKLSIDGYVDYAALEPGCKSVYIVSEKIPHWIYDSEKSLQHYNYKEHLDESNSEKVYSWAQNNEEIIFWLPLTDEVTKVDLQILIKQNKLEVIVKNKSLITGTFFYSINENLSFWLYEKNKVEIHLLKIEKGLIWEKLLLDDYMQEEIFESESVKNSLKKVDSKHTNEENGAFSSLSMQQLEECDNISSDSVFLIRMESSSHLITHKINLSSNQWLFDVQCDPYEVPAICCRLDVDACIWQFKKINNNDSVWPHEHVGTFFAFGYVQASKTQKKFLTCPPNLTYAIVCDSSHHIYVYRNPLPLKSELKNRQTGQKVTKISKQQLINLGTNEQILGINACNNFLYILLESKIFIAILNV